MQVAIVEVCARGFVADGFHNQSHNKDVPGGGFVLVNTEVLTKYSFRNGTNDLMKSCTSSVFSRKIFPIKCNYSYFYLFLLNPHASPL